MSITLSENETRAAALIKHARHAVAFTGAGMSTASGIPDFRSPDSGLWNNVEPFAVASLYGFRQNPLNFYKWVEPLIRLTRAAQPNPAHITLANFEEAGYLRAVITQNIDGLHTRAGSRNVHELHGHMREATCIRCFKIYPAEPIIDQFLEDGLVPHCPACQAVLKPNVVLFGEALPDRALMAAREQIRKADVLVIIGSSLEVAPACDLPLIAVKNGAKLIIINLEPTPADHLAEVVIHDNAAVVLPHLSRNLEAQV